jgi:hypothetical protein
VPLKQGSDKQTIESNIGELIRAGHPPAQAEAIAYHVAGEDKRPDPPKRNYDHSGKPAKK